MDSSNQLPNQSNDLPTTPLAEKSEATPLLTPKPSKIIKKVSLITLAILLVGAGSVYLYTKFIKKDQPSPSQTATIQQLVQADTNKVWVLSYFDKEDKHVEIAYDGSAVKSLEEGYTPSPTDTYIAKLTEKGIEVAKANNPNDITVVLKKEEGVSVAFRWYDDKDQLIVYTGHTTNEPDDPDQDYIPNIEQSFYKVMPDGSGKIKLFDHQETYGAAYIIGASDEHDEFYWSIDGEGGPRAFVNVSSLSTGKLKKEIESESGNGGAKVVFLRGSVYYDGDDKIQAADLRTGEEKMVANPLGELAGFTDTLLTVDCYVGGSIESINYDGASTSSILYSTVTNKPHETIISTLGLADKTSKKLLTLESVRQINILASDNNKILFSRARVNQCNARDEDIETTNLSVLDRASGKVTEVDLNIKEQFFSGEAVLFEKP